MTRRLTEEQHAAAIKAAHRLMDIVQQHNEERRHAAQEAAEEPFQYGQCWDTEPDVWDLWDGDDGDLLRFL